MHGSIFWFIFNLNLIIQNHKIVRLVKADVGNMVGGSALGFLRVTQNRTGGTNRVRFTIQPEAGKFFDVKLLFQKIFAVFSLEKPVV